jgi:hypothetical protein
MMAVTGRMGQPVRKVLLVPKDFLERSERRESAAKLARLVRLEDKVQWVRQVRSAIQVLRANVEILAYRDRKVIPASAVLKGQKVSKGSRVFAERPVPWAFKGKKVRKAIPVQRAI